MVASWVGDAAPTSSPTETRCALTMPSNGADDIGIAVIDRRDLGVGLGLLQVGLGVVAGRSGGIERRLRDRLPRDQIDLALVVGFGLLQRRLRAGFRRLGLLEFQLVGSGSIVNSVVPCFHEAAVLVVDRLQHALHPRHEIDALDRRGVAGGFEITRDGPLHRHADIDLRRRRRHKAILFAAAERDERQYDESNTADGDGPASRDHSARRSWRTRQASFPCPNSSYSEKVAWRRLSAIHE